MPRPRSELISESRGGAFHLVMMDELFVVLKGLAKLVQLRRSHSDVGSDRPPGGDNILNAGNQVIRSCFFDMEIRRCRA